MPDVTSKEQLKQYVFRALGAPLINIDVADEQIEDRIDEALSFFREYYFDGIEKLYLKHQLTAEDIDNQYIDIPAHVWSINRVFPFPTSSASSQMNIFDLQYQLRMNDLRDLTSTSMIYYQQVMSHISLIDHLLNTQKQFRFNKLNGKLYIDQRWTAAQGLAEGQWLIFDAYAALDPATSPRLWNDRLFKEYCVALTKRQWGANLSKYQNIALPGGVTLDGQRIYDEGKTEAEAIEEQIMDRLSPLEFQMG
jgi:hypothetical protein